jgi:hypothetical protein
MSQQVERRTAESLLSDLEWRIRNRLLYGGIGADHSHYEQTFRQRLLELITRGLTLETRNQSFELRGTVQSVTMLA